MISEITITEIDENLIEILGVKYYSEKYLQEMVDRAYQNGLRKGQTIHVAEIQYINTPEQYYQGGDK